MSIKLQKNEIINLNQGVKSILYKNCAHTTLLPKLEKK